MMDVVLSIVVLAAIALLIGAWFLFRRKERRQAWLMVVLALVMLVNVAIWSVPSADGPPPFDRLENGGFAG